MEDLYEEWRSHKIYLYKIPGLEIPVPVESLEEKLKNTQLNEKYLEILELIDGNRSIEEISNKTQLTIRSVRNIVGELMKQGGLIKEVRVVK